MAVAVWSLAAVLICVFLLIIALWWLAVAAYYWWTNRDFVYARGANGIQGETLVLTCPVNSKIQINTAKLSCADLDASGLQPSLDPFNNDGTWGSNSQDVKAAMAAACNGKSSASFTVPAYTPNSGSVCNSSQLVATYYCA